MIKFSLGVMVGFVLATIGLSGVTHVVDTNVSAAQHYLKDKSK